MGHGKVKLGRVTDADIRLFRMFKVIVDAKGLAAAEVELGISRSTISTHLTNLETRLGMRLCERGRGGFSLTGAGAGLYSVICSLLNSLDHCQNEINILQEGLTGQLTVALSDNNIWNDSLNLVESIGSFMSDAPGVKLNLLILSANEMEIKLLDGEVDIGISTITRRLPGLNYTERFIETVYVYCGRKHPFFSVDDNAMSDQDIIESDLIFSDYFPDNIAGRPNERSYIISNHLEAAAMFVLSGKYISFLPDFYADFWVARGDMRRLKPETFFAKMPSGVITRKGRVTTPAQAAFLKSLPF